MFPNKKNNMNCFTMNERLYNSILNFMERKDDSEQKAKTALFEKIYSAGFEGKRNYEPRPSTKINTCSQIKLDSSSEYRDKFDRICKPLSTDRKEMFQLLFKGYGYGNEFFMDHQGITYNSNYVTTQDLAMNHLTKGICGPVPRKFSKGKYIPETDLTAIYPNLTNWGLKEKLNGHENESMCKPLLQVSEYRAKFMCQ